MAGLLSVGTSSYKYDGLGNRIAQTVSSTVTTYLLDLQPGLARVLTATTGSTTNRYVHSPRGIHAMEAAGAWTFMGQDGLGSVRFETDGSLLVQGQVDYQPYGGELAANGSLSSPFKYAGEQVDEIGLSYNRARYYHPAMGTFLSLDPFEGSLDNPMTLNRYGYANNNPVNRVDPTGMFDWLGHRADTQGDCLICMAREMGISDHQGIRDFINAMLQANSNDKFIFHISGCSGSDCPSPRFPWLKLVKHTHFQ